MSLFSMFFGSPAPAPAATAVAPAHAASGPATVTVPVASSGAVISTTVSNGLNLLTVLTTYLASSGIDVNSLINTASSQQFWSGLAATGIALLVKHVVVSNSNAATVAAVASAASAVTPILQTIQGVASAAGSAAVAGASVSPPVAAA